MCNYKEGAL